MKKNGWSLVSMLVFCSILLLGFFSAIVVAEKNFKGLFENVDDVKLTNSVNDVINKEETKTEHKDVDYSTYEEELKNAATYYVQKRNINKKIITSNELIKYNYIKEIHDPSNYENTCKGYVIYNNDEYTPYLRCIGSYATDGYNLDFE